MVGFAARCRTPCSPYSGKARVNATTTAERFASAPPVVKEALAFAGSPNLQRNQARVCRSISLAAGDVRQVASWGLYAATRVSAITEAMVTLGLNNPKYRG